MAVDDASGEAMVVGRLVHCHREGRKERRTGGASFVRHGSNTVLSVSQRGCGQRPSSRRGLNPWIDNMSGRRQQRA